MDSSATIQEQVTDSTNLFEIAGYDRRFFAAIIDTAIGVVFSIAAEFIMRPYIGLIYSRFLVSLFWAIFCLLLIVKYGGTPGKFLLRIRIVNKQGTFISLGAAVLRSSLILLVMTNSLCKYYHVFSELSLSMNPKTSADISHAIKTNGGVFNIIGTVLIVISLIDVGVILLRNNKQNRAIHDFIARSYVVKKESYCGIP